ncbi:MAG: hypothetical protein QOK16_3018 [Solirubrobacteraceae bacterium]|jgi:hypothetical protein|nr:hypothetical protein [Solirubrobacteraceae bacterium]
MRARLSAYGGGTYLGLRREIRDAAGIEVGDDARCSEQWTRILRAYGAATHLIVPLRQDWTSRPVARSTV